MIDGSGLTGTALATAAVELFRSTADQLQDQLNRSALVGPSGIGTLHSDARFPLWIKDPDHHKLSDLLARVVS